MAYHYSEEEKAAIEAALDNRARNKNKNYSIRLSEEMTVYITAKSRAMGMLPSEFIRYLVQRDMEGR